MRLRSILARLPKRRTTTLSRRMLVALVVGFACVIGMLVVNEIAHMRTSDAVQEVHDAHQLRTTLNNSLRELAMAESAQRGYVLSGDSAYLVPYQRAKGEIAQLQRQLASLAAVESSLQPSVVAFSQTMMQNLAEMELVIRLRKEDKVEAASYIVTTNVGLEQMERVRTLADQLITSAEARIVHGRSQTRHLLNVTRFGLAACILAALFGFVSYTQQSRRLLLKEDEYKRLLEAERDALESQVQERTARLTELATHLQQAVESERAHLARELHDELGALLTAAKLDVARLKSRLPAEAPEMHERLKHMTETLNQGIALKRRIIEDLRPSALSNLGLVASLEILAREFGERTHMEMDVALEPVDLDEARELTIYRMVQESLTNVGKYANAHKVTITLKNYFYHAEVTVADDGVGFDGRTPSRSTHGLVGMRHRIEACGGRLDVNSASGRGTRLTASIPRQQRKPQDDVAQAMTNMSVSSHSYSEVASAPTTPPARG